MKLAVCRKDARTFLGVVTDTGLVDATSWAEAARCGTSEPSAAQGWDALLPLLADDMSPLRRHIADLRHVRIDMETVELLPPLTRPGKIVAVGTNYLDHAIEVGRNGGAAGSHTGVSAAPRLLGIFSSSIAGPSSAVPVPPSVKKLDFEAELAVVIGKPGKNIQEQFALDHVLGYMTANDFSAREYQFDINPPQTTRAKSMDGFTPLGPWVTTADELADPQNLAVRCWVNGELVQDGHTSQMQFGVAELIARISEQFSLHTGDLILTGTPAGCGAFRKPPRYLRPGDTVRTHIDHLGELVTTIA